MTNYELVDLGNLTIWLEVVPALEVGIASAQEVTRRAHLGQLNSEDKHRALDALASRRKKTVPLNLPAEHLIFAALAELQEALEAIPEESPEQILHRRIGNHLNYIDTPDHDTRMNAVKALIAIGDAAIPLMIAYARRHERGWRILMVLDAVAEIGTPAAAEALEAISGEQGRAAGYARSLVSKLSDQ